MDYKLTDFLPTTKKECELEDGTSWTSSSSQEMPMLTIHPSGPAILGRILEANGYRVAIVPQPDWHGDFRVLQELGRPRLFFGVSPEPWTRW